MAKKETTLKHKYQLITDHSNNEQCKSWAQVKIHQEIPTYVCTEHYLAYQSQGLVLGQPVLITFPKGKDGV